MERQKGADCSEAASVSIRCGCRTSAPEQTRVAIRGSRLALPAPPNGRWQSVLPGSRTTLAVVASARRSHRGRPVFAPHSPAARQPDRVRMHGMSDRVRETGRVAHTQIESLAGHRVQRLCSVTDPHRAVRTHARPGLLDQWISSARAHPQNATMARAEGLLQFRKKRRRRARAAVRPRPPTCTRPSRACGRRWLQRPELVAMPAGPRA